MANNWLKVAGVMGASAVGLGAYGAHGLMKSPEAMKEVWKTATIYHFVHTGALTVSALHFHGRKRNIVCGLFTGGIVLFSGACYTVVIMNQRKPFSNLAPFGGFMFIAGWLTLGFL